MFVPPDNEDSVTANRAIWKGAKRCERTSPERRLGSIQADHGAHKK
jgi:hypothetical protein